MVTIAEWIEALEILAKHSKKGKRTELQTSAEHDVLYLGLDGGMKPLSAGEDNDEGDFVHKWKPKHEADAARFDDIGIHWDDEYECFRRFT